MKTMLCFFYLIIFNQGIGQLIKPSTLNDGIATATLGEVGMNEFSINEIAADITSGYYPNIHSLLIYKDNKLAYENYFPGKDQLWGKDLGVIKHSINDLHDVRSVSKSVVSACIGIALAQGKIKSVDQKLFDFFKEYAAYDTGMTRELNIKHLLTMTSGLKWNEEVPYDNPENSEIQMTMSDDPIGFILSRPLTTQPGQEWKYNGGTTQLLATIIERVSGKKVDEFAKEYLFKPLGISKFEWVKLPQTNTPAAASGLRLRSRDLLKFGILYHNKEKWNGRQVISEEWIEQSFQPRIQSGRNSSYGYHFWMWSETMQKQNIKIVAAVGNGDQRIFFDKRNNLLVVLTLAITIYGILKTTQTLY